MLITDIHINLANPGQSLLFPGPRLPGEEDARLIQSLIQRAEVTARDDFMVSWEGAFFRGHRDRHPVDGEWLRLRQMAKETPTLDTLITPLPRMVRAMLLSPRLLGGGLVYLTGAPGSGKTTSCSASVISRLQKFGGYARTLEDPPEMPLNGWHNQGFCSQTWVPGDSRANWQDAIRGTLRSQPTDTPCILYVGEARDQESAAGLILAASSGFLVFATGHGTDIPTALDGLISRASGRDSHSGDAKAERDALAAVVKMVLHQRIEHGRLSVTTLVSSSPRSAAANKIRSGLLSHLEGDIQFQANQMMMNVDLLDEAE